MPTRPAPPCPAPRCTHRKPCPVHPVTRWFRNQSTTTTARGYGWSWEKIKRRVLSRDSNCGICGYIGLANDMVDHIVPKVKGGTDAESNLQRVHRTCHATKTSDEGRGRQVLRRSRP